jgi:hypothetical protein
MGKTWQGNQEFISNYKTKGVSNIKQGTNIYIVKPEPISFSRRDKIWINMTVQKLLLTC